MRAHRLLTSGSTWSLAVILPTHGTQRIVNCRTGHAKAGRRCLRDGNNCSFLAAHVAAGDYKSSRLDVDVWLRH